MTEIDRKILEGCEVIVYHQYHPPGVTEIIAWGSTAYIGLVDESTVLKFSLAPGGDLTRLKLEHQLLLAVGKHPRIISLKGFTDIGLLLERALNGTVQWYLTESDHPAPSPQKRVSWCRELAEAVEHVHSKSVIHCDIQPANLLLDEDLHVKLTDFQGYLISDEGKVLVSGWSGEPCRYVCPREDVFHADRKTDLFALGSTIYFIMRGHEVFPDIVGGQENWSERVKSRFENGEFPCEPHLCDGITRNCWWQKYESASHVLADLRAIEENPA